MILNQRTINQIVKLFNNQFSKRLQDSLQLMNLNLVISYGSMITSSENVIIFNTSINTIYIKNITTPSPITANIINCQQLFDSPEWLILSPNQISMMHVRDIVDMTFSEAFHSTKFGIVIPVPKYYQTSWVALPSSNSLETAKQINNTQRPNYSLHRSLTDVTAEALD